MSNKTNLIVIQCILYFLIGWALKSYGVSLTHMVIICVLLILISILNHLMGVSKGIFVATLHRKELDEFVKYMDKHKGKDEELEDLIEHIEKTYNKENEEK